MSSRTKHPPCTNATKEHSSGEICVHAGADKAVLLVSFGILAKRLSSLRMEHLRFAEVRYVHDLEIHDTGGDKGRNKDSYNLRPESLAWRDFDIVR